MTPKPKKPPRSQKPTRKPRAKLSLTDEEWAKQTGRLVAERRAAERERDEWLSKAEELLRWADAMREEFHARGIPRRRLPRR